MSPDEIPEAEGAGMSAESFIQYELLSCITGDYSSEKRQAQNF
jgi:hypothetical protein